MKFFSSSGVTSLPSSFLFTFLCFGSLYIIIKAQLLREQLKFNAKFKTLNSEIKKTARAQETYKGILEINSTSKINVL
mgnify:CR=1 FL=1